MPGQQKLVYQSNPAVAVRKTFSSEAFMDELPMRESGKAASHV
jgi:hypothetical protein